MAGAIRESPTTAVFGWQGFSIEHPVEWAPVALTGNRREGYARLMSPGRIGCQLRWKRARTPRDLEARLAGYFSRLARDARRSKQDFKTESAVEDGRWTYRWLGAGQGRGVLFFSEACSRVFFIEAFGGRKDPLLPVLKCIVGSFLSHGSGDAVWSVLGLSMRLPGEFELDGKVFQAGRTRLSFRRRRCALTAERWGLAEQLLAKHDLVGWASAVLAMPRARAEPASQDLVLRQDRFLRKGATALVRHDAERNQIVLLKCSGRLEPRPEWLC